MSVAGVSVTRHRPANVRNQRVRFAAGYGKDWASGVISGAAIH